MQTLTRRTLTALLTLAACGYPALAADTPTTQPKPEKLKTLLITGQNNHDWQRTTPMIKRILEAAGRFDVTVSTTPPKGAPKAAWESWHPNFKAYDVLVSDYYDQDKIGGPWSEPIRKAFEQYVADGGAVVIVHAANNAFDGWNEYEKMVGLLWRNADAGYRVFFDDDGKEHRVPPGKGPGASHGAKHDFQIQTRQPDQPIFKGVPKVWLHAFDELYHTQRGPAENMHILATAYDAPKTRGTGKHEPMIWWIPYGKGKVLTFLPGHLWKGQKDLRAFECVGFQTLLPRCTEWVATGKVTIPVPKDFPTADHLSTRKLW
jgi:hypothetical protein